MKKVHNLQIERAHIAWDIFKELAQKNETISYGDLGTQMGLTHHRPILYFLELIQDYCIRNNLPPLSILVINKGGLPGSGFIQSEISEFENEKQKVFNYNWDSLSNPFVSTKDTANNLGIQGICDIVTNGWGDYRSGITTNKNHPVHSAICDYFPEILKSYLEELGAKTLSQLTFNASVGLGRITSSPWGAVFDSRVTNSATKGFYPVYHFSEDMTELHFCLGLGVEQFIKAFGNNKVMLIKMENSVNLVREIFTSKLPENFYCENTSIGIKTENSKHESYQKGVIFNVKPYNTKDIDIARFKKDLFQMVQFYQMMIDDPRMPTNESLIIHQGFKPRAPLKVIKITAADLKPSPKNTALDNRIEIGKLGEKVVLNYEREKLERAGREDLAKKIVAHCELNEFKGWDISSFKENGEPIYIEVKSTTANYPHEFYISPNEWDKCQEHRDKYFVYRVTNVASQSAQIYVIENLANEVECGNMSIIPSSYKIFKS